MRELPRLALVLAVTTVVACASVLGIKDSEERNFEHRAHLLEGIACVKCHSQMADEGRVDRLNLPGTQSCLACHKEPHDARECGQCHGKADNRNAAMDAKRHLRFNHAAHEQPASGQCVRCHRAVAEGDGPLRPNMAICLSCHQHRDQWGERDCGGCHMDMAAEGTRPHSHVVHGPNFMTNHGTKASTARDLCSTCHTESQCLACHGVSVPALPNVWHFDDPHRPDMHPANFQARHSLEARADPALCTTCHSESSCIACHDRKGLLQASAQRGSPHPAGWLGTPGSGNLHGQEARRDPVSCASCHGGSGEQLCVGCHQVGGAGGNPHPPGFHSDKRMSERPCRLCHTGEL